MRHFKTKPLYSLLLSALAGTASAVNLGNDGTGQVLIYPYYTVRTAGPGDWATYLNVVNHTSDTKALRLRFREGKNGRSVFDINLYLGSGDVWAGAVSKTADAAQLISADRSCVTASGSFAQSVAAGALSPAFSNAMYVGPSTTQGVFDGYDGEDSSLDRTREGFFEIVEMGVVTSTAIINGLKHDASGIPANCGVVANLNGSVIGAPRGGISGGASLIHVLKGADFGYDPVVLEDFYRPAQAGDNLWTAPGNRLPDLSQATPVSRVLYLHTSATAATPNGMVTDVLETQWSRGIDAVSAVLMRDTVKNSYVLDAATLSSTDWVVTMPTKHHYISANASESAVTNDPNGTQLLAPFQNFFWTGGATNGVSFDSWNREEYRGSACSAFSDTGGPRCFFPLMKWQTNVGTVVDGSYRVADEATLLGSKDRIKQLYSWRPDDPVPPQYELVAVDQHGYAMLTFTGGGPLVGIATGSLTPESYYGLPIVGFMTQDFINTNVTLAGLPSTSSYGGNFNHTYTRRIKGGNVRP